MIHVVISNGATNAFSTTVILFLDMWLSENQAKHSAGSAPCSVMRRKSTYLSTIQLCSHFHRRTNRQGSRTACIGKYKRNVQVITGRDGPGAAQSTQECSQRWLSGHSMIVKLSYRCSIVVMLKVLKLNMSMDVVGRCLVVSIYFSFRDSSSCDWVTLELFSGTLGFFIRSG